MKSTRSQKKLLDTQLDKNSDLNNLSTSKKKKKPDAETPLNTNTDSSLDTNGYINYISEISTNLKDFKLVPKFFTKVISQTNDTQLSLSKILKFTIISPLELYYKIKYDEFNKLASGEEKCSICLCEVYEDNLKNFTYEEIKEYHDKIEKNNECNVIMLSQCKDHFFHDECIKSMMGTKEHIKCPVCNKLYGIMTGDQPKGVFLCRVIKEKCAGYKENTIQLYYDFPDGTNYKGTSRNAYIPNTKEGKEILALFKITFDRGLMYIIGNSVTTGEKNVVVWNGVHHKTNLDGGAQYFGYPDPTYFNRVREEMAAKGVVQSEIKEDLVKIADNFILQCELGKAGNTSTGSKSRSKKI